MTDHHSVVADISVGDSGPELVIEEVGRIDLVKYAGASGDFNPIHYHEEAAVEAGHPGVIAQGMFTAGLMETMVTDWFGVGNIRRFGVRFTDVVQPGDKIVVTGKVEDTMSVGDEVIIEADFKATIQDGTTVVTGNATAVLPLPTD